MTKNTAVTGVSERFRSRFRVGELRKNAPAMLVVFSALCLAWLVCSMAFPLRLREPDRAMGREFEDVSVRGRTVDPFSAYERTVGSRLLFAPPTPLAANRPGTVVIDELLSKIKLSGISSIQGEMTALISVKGKSGSYRAGDEVGSFRVKTVQRDKVVLELNGDEVDLTP